MTDLLIAFVCGGVLALVGVGVGAAMTYRLRIGRPPVGNPLEAVGASAASVETMDDGDDLPVDRRFVA